MAKESVIGLKLIGKAGLVFCILFWLVLTQPVFAEESHQTSQIQDQILNGQLNNDEVNTIRKAVDRALDDAGDLDYDFSVDEILEKRPRADPWIPGRFPSALLDLLGKEFKKRHFNAGAFAVMLVAALFKGLQPREKGISNESVKLAVNGAMAVIAAASLKHSEDGSGNHRVHADTCIYRNAGIIRSAGSFRTDCIGHGSSTTGIGRSQCCLPSVQNHPASIVRYGGVLFLVDSISDRFRLKNLQKLLKTIAIWVTGAITLVFSIAVSLQKVSGSTVDAAAVKTAKFAIGTLVPVAGKNMSDAAETLLACTHAVRNAAGVVTVIGLAILFAIPFIKMLVIMLVYRLVAAFGSPLGDDNICSALEEAAGCMSVIIGIMGASLFVLILLTGTLMSSTGFL